MHDGDFSRDSLELLGIRALRKLAFSIGVFAPTTYNKTELIDQIQSVIFGVEHPRPEQKRGRPFKETKSKEEVFFEVMKQVPDKAVDVKSILSNPDIEFGIVASSNEPYDAGVGLTERSGMLEILDDGYGFLRANKIMPSENDAYLSKETIRTYGLRKGDFVIALVSTAIVGKIPAVKTVERVNGKRVDLNRPKFDALIPIYPNAKIKMCYDGCDAIAKMIDVIAPIGFGQRALIVSPPKAGKTTILKAIATSICKNNPNTKTMILLIDERPEEVTDIANSNCGEVFSSTFDQSAENHIKTAEFVLERAKRLVESGENVIILMDSLTRLARACNISTSSTGKTLSGGIDPNAIQFSKKFFGSARKMQDGASLTIIATALTETGSKLDDIIFEEFKGTENMELYLSRKLAEKRIFPAIDIQKSGSRKDELLQTKDELCLAEKIHEILSVRKDVNELQIVALFKNAKTIQDLSKNLGCWQK